ncbi:MAG: PAS domain S-box protein [Chloroflexi bacterium]|nr:PAS domain S-box protein [Chloroflexota bacterium]
MAEQTHSDKFTDLRQQAEETLRAKPADIVNLDELSPEDAQRMFHELQVHQIELEMQNEELRRAQQELGASRDRYAELYDFAPVSYFTLNERGLIMEANLTIANLLGAARDDLIKQPLSRFIIHEDQDIYYLHRKTLFETQEPQVCELRMVGKDGVQFWARIEAVVAQDSEGQPICRATVSDITERKRVQEVLRESEKRFRDIINSTQAGYFFIDQDKLWQHVNDAWLQMHGYDSADEVIGQHFSLTQVKVDLEQAQRNVEMLLSGDPIPAGEFSRRCKDGSIAYHTFTAIPVVQAGQAVGLEGFIIDVTERKRAEKALQRRNRDLELLHQANQVFNSTLDLDQMLDAALDEVCRLLDIAACSVWLLDTQDAAPDGSSQTSARTLVCRQATGPHHDLVRGWRLAPGEGIAGWVAQHGEPLNVPDTRSDARHFKEIDRQTGMELCSILSVPLRVKQNLIGVLQLADTASGRFDTVDLALIGSLASVAAAAIENARLYEQTNQDAETKATLLREVKHRVRNNLTSLIGLLVIEKQHAEAEGLPVYRSLLNNLSNRIHGLSTVHSMLSDSEWTPLLLYELVARIARLSSQPLPRGKRVSIEVPPSSVRVKPNQAHNLALVINELATNTVKYALREQDTVHVNICIELDGDTVILTFKNDGPHYPQEVLQMERHGTGLDLLQNIVHRSLGGEMSLRNDGGAVTEIRFKAQT